MLNQQVNRGVRSRDIIVPAPILGLNKKDALSAMDAGYAITMDNYMPLDNKIVLRSGYTKYVTLGQKVQTLVEYKNLSRKFHQIHSLQELLKNYSQRNI